MLVVCTSFLLLLLPFFFEQLVDQSNAVRALSCARNGGVPTEGHAGTHALKWPSLMKDAVTAHFASPAAKDAHAAQPTSYLYDDLVQSAVAVRLQTTFFTFFKHFAAAGVKKALGLLHNLTGRDAKSLSDLLGTSVADRAERLAATAARGARSRAYQARENELHCNTCWPSCARLRRR